MSLKITTRLTLWYCALFGSAIVLLALVRYVLFAWGEQDNLDKQGRAYAETLLADSAVWKTPLPSLVPALDSLGKEAPLQYRGMHFFLHDDKRVLYDNAVRGQVSPVLDSLRPRIGGVEGFRTIDIRSGSYRLYTASPKELHVPGLHLTVIIPREELNATLHRLGTSIALGVILLLITAWVSGLLLARRSLSLVERIRQTAAEITGTDLARRVPVGKTHDELSALGRTFNDMIERLQHYSSSYRLFVTNTFHDLRTPLAVIRAELQLGAEESSRSPELAEMTRRCINQLDRLDRLTADLLFFAKLDTDGLQSRPRNVDLDELVLDCAAGMQGLLQRKKMALEITLPENASVTCVCDDHLVRRAVVNLLDNAINYSPEESTIQISLHTTATEAMITVADNGPGMEEEEARRATERLYRGPASRGSKGSGLGLAIAREIIEAHRGKLTINSTPGEGTSITLLLPLLPPFDRSAL